MRESIWLSEVTKWPTSVFGFASGNRADKSPAAIASAVASILVSGRNEISMIFLEANAIAKSANNPISKNRNLSRAIVRSTSSNETAATTLPNPEGSVRVKTRKCVPVSANSIVCGFPSCATTSAVVMFATIPEN